MNTLELLKQQVEVTVGVQASAVKLINGFVAKLEEALAKGKTEGADAALASVADLAVTMKASTDALGAAVAANQQ